MAEVPSSNVPEGSILLGDQVYPADIERDGRLLEQLRHGYVPSSSTETDEIRSTITQAKHSRCWLDGKVSSLERTISPLVNELSVTTFKRDAVDKFISSQSALMSPVRRLPKELLLEIFDHACPTNHVPVGPLTKCPSLVISHVCHFWRELAVACPQLWSRMVVGLSRDNRSRGELSAEPYLTEMFLELSKDHPLDIFVYCVQDSLWSIGNLIERDQRILSRLRDNAWRWGSLECTTDDLRALPEPSMDLTSLQDVKIHFVGRSGDGDPRPEANWLARATNAERVTMNEYPYPFIPFNWNSLRILIVKDTYTIWTPEMIRGFLIELSTSSPSPQELRWHISTGAVDFIMTPFRLDNLKHLTVGNDAKPDWIIAPNLEHLDVSKSRKTYQGATHRDLTRFLLASGANLTSFTMGNGYLKCDGYTTAFEHMKNLIRLTCCHFDPSEMMQLTDCLTLTWPGDPPENRYLPHLQIFTVVSDPAPNLVFYRRGSSNVFQGFLVDESILMLLESRRSQRLTCFERFEVVSSKNRTSCRNPSCKDRLRQLRNGGLSLCLNDNWSPVEELACDDEE